MSLRPCLVEIHPDFRGPPLDRVIDVFAKRRSCTVVTEVSQRIDECLAKEKRDGRAVFQYPAEDGSTTFWRPNSPTDNRFVVLYGRLRSSGIVCFGNVF